MNIKINDIVINSRKRKLNKDKVRELAESMELIGQLQPITITSENVLLAGWHRVEAAKILGWEDIKAELFDGNELEHELVEIDENLMRNDLTVLEQGEHLARRQELVGRNVGRYAKSNGRMVLPLKTTSEIAHDIGLTESSAQKRMQAARKIVPEVKDAIRYTEIANSTTQLLDLARLTPEQQVEVAQRITGGASSIAEAKRTIRRQDRIESTPVIPDGKYNVIYCDPPWKYDFGFDIHGAADRHYHTMTIQELCDLPIPEIIEENAVLFMWVTSPKLFDAHKIITAWGFDYKTSFIWDKVKHVMGHYNSVRHEILLVCVKGSFPKQSDTLHDSVITIERSDEHSEKPEYFRQLIETMYPKSKKIELFARKHVDGWTVWGNEL